MNRIGSYFLAIVSGLVVRGYCGNADSATGILITRVWKVPPQFFPEPAKDGTKPSHESNDPRSDITAMEFFRQSGLDFPEGAFAKYLPAAHLVLIRNTADNLDLAETMIAGCGPCFFPNPVIDIVALDCALPGSVGRGESASPSPDDIRRLPAGSLRVLSQVSVLGKSGLATSIHQTWSPQENGSQTISTTKLESEPDPNGFQENEFGTNITIEPVVGPDGQTISVAYRYHLRRPIPGKTWSELDLMGTLFLRDNVPMILHVSPLETRGRTLVIIAGVRLMEFDGTKLLPFAMGAVP